MLRSYNTSSCPAGTPSNSLFNLRGRKYDRKAPVARRQTLGFFLSDVDRFARQKRTLGSLGLLCAFIRIPPICIFSSIKIILLYSLYSFFSVVFLPHKTSLFIRRCYHDYYLSAIKSIYRFRLQTFNTSLVFTLY